LSHKAEGTGGDDSRAEKSSGMSAAAAACDNVQICDQHKLQHFYSNPFLCKVGHLESYWESTCTSVNNCRKKKSFSAGKISNL